MENGSVPKRRKEDRLPWFPLYVDKWETDSKVRNMGPAARGIFLTLLMLQWREGSIPDDVLKLLRVTKMPDDPIRTVLDISQVDVEACLEQALECFIPDGQGGLYNETLRGVKIYQEECRDERAKSGRVGGLTKARNRSTARAQLQQTASTASDLLVANVKQNVAIKIKSKTNTESNTKAKALCAFVIPDWVPQEAWNHYEEMRRRIRKPMTDQARKWAVALLDRLRAQGQDLVGVLEQSVFNSWQGLFAVKGETNDDHTQTAGRRDGVGGGTNAPARPNTQAQRAFRNIAAVATVLRGSNRVAEEQRGPGMANSCLTDGTGQKA